MAAMSRSGNSLCPLPPVKREECGRHEENERHAMIPPQALAEPAHRKRREDQKRDHLLHGFQLGRGIDLMTDSIRRYREAVLEERAPAGRDHDPESGRRKFELAVPGEGHEHIGSRQKQDWRDIWPVHRTPPETHEGFMP